MKKYAIDLFPQLNLYRSYWEQREYVESRLIELINNDEFFITDIYNQPNYKATMLAIEIICGTMIQDKKCVDAPIPYEIEDYKVTLKPMNGFESVEWESGWKQIGQLQNKLPILEKQWRRHKVNKDGYVKLKSKDAWIALMRYGANVRSARSERLQSKLWRYEEIHPKIIKEIELKKEEEQSNNNTSTNKRNK